MSNRKYRAFVAAANRKNITRAAEALGYTQSGVSHLLAALEEELGLPLLTRSNLGTDLTPEGAQLLPFAQALLEAEDRLSQQAEALRSLQTGTLRIATFSSAAIHLLPHLLDRYRAQYPGVKVSVLNGGYADVEQALLLQQADCGFVSVPSRPDLRVTVLMEDRLLVILSPQDPRSTRELLTPADLGSGVFIVPAEGRNYNIGKLFASAQVVPQSQLEILDDYTAVELVRRGLGFTILPELLVRNMPMHGLRAVPLQGPARQIGIATLRSRQPSPAVRAFLALVRELQG